jgi:uncharacterized protein (UPF0335 family)
VVTALLVFRRELTVARYRGKVSRLYLRADAGFDVRAVRQIVRIRKQDHSERKEMEAILELYMSALNMH